MPNVSVTQYEAVMAARRTAIWNQTVSKQTVQVIETNSAFMTLHPTKGWRRISKKRLGL